MGPGSGSLRNSGTSTLVSTLTMSVSRPTARFVHHRLADGHGAASLDQLERECLALPWSRVHGDPKNPRTQSGGSAQGGPWSGSFRSGQHANTCTVNFPMLPSATGRSRPAAPVGHTAAS